MNFTTLTIGDKEYKLRLNTRNCIVMEKALGYNPIQLFMELDENKLPKLSDMIIMLQAMLQQYNHGISTNDVYDLMDEFMAEGHSEFDLIPIFLEVFQNSGFVSANTGEVEEPKN